MMTIIAPTDCSRSSRSGPEVERAVERQSWTRRNGATTGKDERLGNMNMKEETTTTVATTGTSTVDEDN